MQLTLPIPSALSFKPFLVNKGTLGMVFKAGAPVNSPRNEPKPLTPQEKKSCNRKRSNKNSSLKRKNFEMAQKAGEQIKDPALSDKQRLYLGKLKRNITACASHSLYREHLSNKAIEFIGSHTCSHKLCFVCNSLAQKRLRRKYLRFFEENEYLALVYNRKTKKQRAVTVSRVKELQNKDTFDMTYQLIGYVPYDIMHLTLTVPHFKDTGFRGMEVYYDELVRQFNFLRKKDKWNQLVYGGEYGVETTNTKNGLNIHIHALLLVPRYEQNRNILHRYILEQWNRMTFNPYSDREQLPDYTKKKILASNALVKWDDGLLEKLNPKGATIIGLDSIFTTDGKGNKKRVKAFNSNEMIAAVMEAISYHFQPQCFDKESGTYDFDLMVKIMPEIEGKPLYRKFGCLHGERSLNIKTSERERIMEDFQESGQEDVYNPETLERAEREEYTFFVANAAHVWHDTSCDFRPIVSRKAKKVYLDSVENTLDALDRMTRMAVDAIIRENNKRKRAELVLKPPGVPSWNSHG